MQHKPLTIAYMCRKNLLDRGPARQRMVQRETASARSLINRKKPSPPKATASASRTKSCCAATKTRYTHQLD